MKKKVRVIARVVPNANGTWTVVKTNGVKSFPYFSYEDAKRSADYCNNEDSDYPEYMEVEVEDESDNTRVTPNLEGYYARMERERKAREERKRKQKEREENNRKSRKSNDKFVYVVSCYERGVSGVVYMQGETNLTKITKRYGGGFICTKETEAKVFNTKAAAQKFVDTISKCWMVNSLFRDIKVVQKRKDKMGVK